MTEAKEKPTAGPRATARKTVVLALKSLAVALAGTFAFAACAAAGFVAATVKPVPVYTYNKLKARLVPKNETNFAYFRDGTLIGPLRTEEDHRVVSKDEVSPHFLNALIATEDHRFYEHRGVAPRAFLRAVG